MLVKVLVQVWARVMRGQEEGPRAVVHDAHPGRHHARAHAHPPTHTLRSSHHPQGPPTPYPSPFFFLIGWIKGWGWMWVRRRGCGVCGVMIWVVCGCMSELWDEDLKGLLVCRCVGVGWCFRGFMDVSVCVWVVCGLEIWRICGCGCGCVGGLRISSGWSSDRLTELWVWVWGYVGGCSCGCVGVWLIVGVWGQVHPLSCSQYHFLKVHKSSLSCHHHFSSSLHYHCHHHHHHLLIV